MEPAVSSRRPKRKKPHKHSVRRKKRGLKKRFNLHHIYPTSRKGQTDEFNLFPFKVIRHNCWHKLFLNMTIREIWERLDDIYKTIFNDEQELINRHWLSVCELSSMNDLNRQVEKMYNAENLADAWTCAFETKDLPAAKLFVKYMALFLIFGSDMMCPKKLFDNDYLTAFFAEFPLENERKWAFQICFGADDADGADLDGIKLKIQEILSQFPSP